METSNRDIRPGVCMGGGSGTLVSIHRKKPRLTLRNQTLDISESYLYRIPVILIRYSEDSDDLSEIN